MRLAYFGTPAEAVPPLEAVLVWNAVDSGGTTNVPPALASLDKAYTDVAFVQPLPASGPSFVVDPACALRCGINATAINGYAPPPTAAAAKNGTAAPSGRKMK